MERTMRIRFWGVRGSVPAPLTPAQVEDKAFRLLKRARSNPRFSTMDDEELLSWLQTDVPFVERSTYGGNTTCVEVRCGDVLFIIDMGTGLREFGVATLKETLEQKGLSGFILQSHVHWDHVQGLPFLPQLYMNKKIFKNTFTFYGGKEWDADLEKVLRGQMDHPVFPVQFGEISNTGMEMKFHSIYDGWSLSLTDADGETIHVLARKLNHPQETFGYRIEYRGSTFCFTTDHEPYGNDATHVGLLQLATNADLWVTDCQYDLDEYLGSGGRVQKCGWGHSYPEYLAKIAKAAHPKRILTTHHDPGASDERIEELSLQVERLCDIQTRAAYEGLTIVLDATSVQSAPA